MSIYTNCYEIVAEVRRDLNEYSTGRLQGTDTTGAFTNEAILKAVNDAQKFVWDILFARMPHLWLASSSLTAVSSVITLPSDFFKLRRIETSDRVKVQRISVDQRHLNDDEGSKYLYYRKGNTLVIDKDSLGDTITLWYFKRPRNLTFGQATAGAALSITLATTARAEADYYNGMTIDDTTAGFASTISDYSAARVATITGTAAASDWYGLVSELPEEFHHLISRRASLVMRTKPQSINPPSLEEVGLFKEDLVESVRSYCGELDEDITPEDVFLNLEPYIP